MANEFDTLSSVEPILREARTVAILGAHVEPSKPAHYVPDFLQSRGYEVLPVNPVFAGRRLWDKPVVGSLGELAVPVDVVDVFRRAEHLPSHLEEILALSPSPRWVWFQLGIRNDEVAEAFRRGGIEVVQDRCMLADHQSLFP